MANPYLEFLAVAERLARRAGRLLADERPTNLHVEHKGAVDLVTEMDRRAEEMIVDTITATFPTHAIVAEEGSDKKAKSEFRWYIDPLDGTTNYTHGLPIYCVSIALAHAGELVCGAVYDPSQEEMYTAIQRGGAFRNGSRIQVSGESELRKSLLVTGFPYDIRESGDNNLPQFAKFAIAAQAVRRLGSAALDLCWVAAGRFDGFWELKLSPWDMAAGVVFVREAGGLVTDFDGSPYDLHSGRILATNGKIHQQMMTVLAE